jgi:hypothetical protein
MPPRHPLFKMIPPRDLIFSIFGDLGLHIGHVFTRDSFDLEKAVGLVGGLRQYYFDCKSADLFTNINEKRLITILRQCFKVHGYTLKGRETTRGGQKVIQYTVSKEDDSILEEPIIISFD